MEQALRVLLWSPLTLYRDHLPRVYVVADSGPGVVGVLFFAHQWRILAALGGVRPLGLGGFECLERRAPWR
jgi:hypothetical protein